MDEELRRLQLAHQRALQAAQRQEDSRRKRLHMSETNAGDRKQLNRQLEDKRKKVLANGRKQRLLLQKRLARRNERVKLTAEEAAQKQALAQAQRQRESQAAAERDAERREAQQKKIQEHALRKKQLTDRALERAAAQRERQAKADQQETEQIAARLNKRLNKKSQMQKSVIDAIKKSQGRKNRKWRERVVVTKARPDFRAATVQARLTDKYRKIEERKQAALTLQKHKKMLADKLIFQQQQWAKEYNQSTAAKARPSTAKIHAGTRIKKSDLIQDSLPEFGTGSGHANASSPTKSKPPKIRPSTAGSTRSSGAGAAGRRSSRGADESKTGGTPLAAAASGATTP